MATVVKRVDAAPTPSDSVEEAEALVSINSYRAMSGLPAVTSNDSLTQGDRNHSCYMLANGMSHDESSTGVGYSVEGRYAGMHGNVAVTSDLAKSADGFVQLWMAAPFHSIGILRPNLTSISYGSCTDPGGPLVWRKGATVDVLSGRSARPTLGAPIVWPGNGSTTSLDRFIVETPNPLAMCGWPSGGGLPVVALMPEPVTNASTTITGPTGPLEVCTLFDKNVTDPTARSIFAGDNAVTAIPRNALSPGTYEVTVTTDTRVVSWSFVIDPKAQRPIPGNPIAGPPVVLDPVQPARSPGPPINPIAAVIGPAGGYRSVSPFRIVDTRNGSAIGRPAQHSLTRLQVAGQGSVPADARAVSANFTAVSPMQDGYLSAFACTPTLPTASTLNFTRGSVAANAALVALDESGGLCVYSSADTDLVVDVSGYMSPTVAGFFTPTMPERAFDTRISYRTTGRLSAGQTLEVQITGSETGVPIGADAVSMNVTAVNPSADSFITVYPCSPSRPLASTLNPQMNAVRSNAVLVGLSAAGTVCFYSQVAVDVIADVSGFISSNGGLRFTPLLTARLLDTRSLAPEVDLGTSGLAFQAGSTHELFLGGLRGIPLVAQALSINLTSTDTVGIGFITVWPCSQDRPGVSALNAAEGTTVAAGAQAQLSTNGAVCVYTQVSTHLIIDVAGYWGMVT